MVLASTLNHAHAPHAVFVVNRTKQLASRDSISYCGGMAAWHEWHVVLETDFRTSAATSLPPLSSCRFVTWFPLLEHGTIKRVREMTFCEQSL